MQIGPDPRSPHTMSGHFTLSDFRRLRRVVDDILEQLDELDGAASDSPKENAEPEQDRPDDARPA